MINENKSEKNKILKFYKSSLSGLNSTEVKRRLKKDGPNELPKEKKKSISALFFGSFNDPIIYVLIVAAILSFIVGETLDGCTILFIILVDGIVSTIQEYRANQNSEALKNLIKVKVKVIRENKKNTIKGKIPPFLVVLKTLTKKV